MLNLFVLLGVGMLTAFAAAFFVDRMSGRHYDDDVIRSAYQLEKRYDLPVLASIPHIEIPADASSGPIRRPFWLREPSARTTLSFDVFGPQ